MNTNTTKPWYRYPIVWLVLGLPLMVVFASFITYFLAMRGLDAVVSKDAYKEGLAVNTDLVRDKAAAQMGLVGKATIDGNQATLYLTAKDSQAQKGLAGAPIHLELENLSFQRTPLTTTLIETRPGQWQGKLTDSISPATWRVYVSAGNWRMTQRVEYKHLGEFTIQP